MSKPAMLSLSEAILATAQGVVLGRSKANLVTELKIKAEREGIATRLVLRYTDGQEHEMPLPPQLVSRGEVQNFGRLKLKRVAG